MKTKISVLMMLVAATAAAQSSNGYVFFAPGGLTAERQTVMTLHAGGGLDAIVAKGVGLNLELGGLWPRKCFSDCVMGVFSPGGVFYFRGGTGRKLDPFVNGGYSLMFRGDRENLFYFGGGANYWISENVGLRMEFRDHVLNHDTTAHFWSFRLGLAFR